MLARVCMRRGSVLVQSPARDARQQAPRATGARSALIQGARADELELPDRHAELLGDAAGELGGAPAEPGGWKRGGG
eukprot:11635587-Alexandrium_andersonii.AAC.1